MKMKKIGTINIKKISIDKAVDKFSDLPEAHLNTGMLVLVKSESGIWPFKKEIGRYVSDGKKWHLIK